MWRLPPLSKLTCSEQLFGCGSAFVTLLTRESSVDRLQTQPIMPNTLEIII